MTAARAALVVLAALVLADAAAGAYAPRLTAHHGRGGVELTFSQTTADDASAVLVLNTPARYAATLGQASGTTVGRVSAQIEVRALAPGSAITLDGTMVAESPASHAGNSCAPGLHQGVWVAVLPVPGQQPIRLPVYVDANPDPSLGAFRLQACLPSPDVPESLGGAGLGAKLLQATFAFERTFVPLGTGVFQWLGRFVPYVPGTSTPNAAAAVESRALVRTPGRVSLRGHRVVRSGRQVAVLAGVVSEASSGISGVVVRIRGGGRSRTARTRPSGGFLLTVPLRRSTTFTASVNVPDRNVTAAVCPTCSGVTASGFQASSRPAKVTVPKRTSKR